MEETLYGGPLRGSPTRGPPPDDLFMTLYQLESIQGTDSWVLYRYNPLGIPQLTTSW